VPVKKTNVFSINLSDTAVISLQHINYLDGKKRGVKGCNLSDFISRLIVDFIGVNYPGDSVKIREKLLLCEMKHVNIKRGELDVEIEGLALKLRALRDVRGEMRG